MLQRLIQFSLERSVLVLVLAAVLLVFVGFRLTRMPVDVFPELNAPTVVVMTEAPGLAADEVEQYVTFPIETAVNGIPGARLHGSIGPTLRHGDPAKIFQRPHRLMVKGAGAYMRILVEQAGEFAAVFLYAGMFTAEHIK